MVDVRWARIEDAAGVAIVHVEAWRAAYTGLIDQEILDGLSVDGRAASWAAWITNSLARRPTDGDNSTHRLLVAIHGTRVVGWAGFGAGRDEGDGKRGELAGLYVHPEYWGHGVGHSLMTRVEQELRAAGWVEAYLWVLHGNERAIRFYEQHGWAAHGGEKTGSAGNAQGLHELRHVRGL